MKRRGKLLIQIPRAESPTGISGSHSRARAIKLRVQIYADAPARLIGGYVTFSRNAADSCERPAARDRRALN